MNDRTRRPVVAFDMTPLSTGSRFRGIGTYTWALGQALAAESYEDFDLRFIVGADGRYELWTPDRATTLDTVLAACGGREVTPYRRYYLQKRTALRRFVDRSGIALLHCPDPKGTSAAGLHRTVVTAHDLIPTILGPPYRWWPKAAMVAVDRTRYLPHDHVIAISAWTARDLQRELGLSAERISVVHHGVDLERFYAEEPSDRGDEPYFFYVGGFDRRKQVFALIRAFAQIADRVPESLWIAGEPPRSARLRILAAARRYGVTDRIRMLGFVPGEDLPGLYRRATAHVLPTMYEGFGMTALEAMASGCPVVTLRATCVPEVCGDAALYSEPGDWDRYAENLVEVSQQAERRGELRRLGLSHAATFEWARAAEATATVYRTVLGTR